MACSFSRCPTRGGASLRCSGSAVVAPQTVAKDSERDWLIQVHLLDNFGEQAHQRMRIPAKEASLRADVKKEANVVRDEGPHHQRVHQQPAQE